MQQRCAINGSGTPYTKGDGPQRSQILRTQRTAIRIYPERQKSTKPVHVNSHARQYNRAAVCLSVCLSVCLCTLSHVKLSTKLATANRSRAIVSLSGGFREGPSRPRPPPLGDGPTIIKNGTVSCIMRRVNDYLSLSLSVHPAMWPTCRRRRLRPTLKKCNNRVENSVTAQTRRPLRFPCPLFPFLPLPPLPLEVGPLKPARGSGGAL